MAGGRPGMQTQLEDESVTQVLSVNDLIRRGRTSAASTGWFRCIMENDHLAAGNLVSTIDPYAPGVTAVAPYPSPVPRGFDFWVLSAALRRNSGAGTLDAAAFSFAPSASQLGWGIDDGGAAVTGVEDAPLALFTGLNTDVASMPGIGISGDGSAVVKVQLRVPPGITSLSFRSTVAGAAATLRLYLICALFPEGLGQDIAP